MPPAPRRASLILWRFPETQAEQALPFAAPSVPAHHIANAREVFRRAAALGAALQTYALRVAEGNMMREMAAEDDDFLDRHFSDAHEAWQGNLGERAGAYVSSHPDTLYLQVSARGDVLGAQPLRASMPLSPRTTLAAAAAAANDLTDTLFDEAQLDDSHPDYTTGATSVVAPSSHSSMPALEPEAVNDNETPAVAAPTMPVVEDLHFTLLRRMRAVGEPGRNDSLEDVLGGLGHVRGGRDAISQWLEGVTEE
ncbi:hypothetical protein DFH09DRAFT_1333312 [Mycena vulgaris]|nr:hypothetical protein DFH09DRAFT_1333312 [Mycena vulgaris]